MGHPDSTPNFSEGSRLAKRYILYQAGRGLSENEAKEVERILRQRHGELKLIRIKGARQALILKTTNRVVADIRHEGGRLEVGGVELVSVLTSGAIGKLKRRALGERHD